MALGVLLSAGALLPGPTLADDSARFYKLAYQATFQPDTGYAQARITVRQESSRLRLMDLNAPSTRYSEFSGDGSITRDGRRVLWQVPAEGGELRYRVQVRSQRSDAPDARMTADWAVMRLDDLFPPARSRSRRGAASQASLTLKGTDGWSFDSAEGATPPRLIVEYSVDDDPDNSPPVATDDSAITDENAAVTVDVLANDSDPDGDALTVGDVTQPDNGSLAINPDGTLTYTPDADFVGDDSFTYRAADGSALSDPATVTVTVEEVPSTTVTFQQGSDGYTGTVDTYLREA